MSAMSWCFWPKDRNTQRSPRAVSFMPSTSSYQGAEAKGFFTKSAMCVRRMRGRISSDIRCLPSIDGLRMRSDRRGERRPRDGRDLAEVAPFLEPAPAAVGGAQQVALLGAGEQQPGIDRMRAEDP